MSRLRGQAGVTLIEVMVTLVILTSGVLATVGLFAETGQATLTAQQKTAMVALAQRELERLRPLPYDRVGLSAAPAADAPALTGPAASEARVDGGAIAPGPEPFAAAGVRGRIHRFVTWRPQACPAVKGKLAERVAAELGMPVDQVAASLTDLCVGTQHTKRITVVLVPDGTTSRTGAVRLSTVAVDPHTGVLANGSFDGLKVDPNALRQAAADPGGAAAQAYASITQQVHHLYDTPCTFSVRQPQTGSHPTHDTGVVGAACGGTRVPDLMGATPAPGTPADVLHDYSDDVPRDAAGGLALTRDDRAGACDSSYQYTGPEAERRMRSVHTWATPATAAAASTADQNGRATVTVWTRAAGGGAAPGRLCAVLWQESTGQVLGSADYALAAWPTEPAQVSVSFDVAAADLPAGDRLLLTLRVPADSGADLLLLYDHPAYASTVSIPMQTGAELQP